MSSKPQSMEIVQKTLDIVTKLAAGVMVLLRLFGPAWLRPYLEMIGVTWTVIELAIESANSEFVRGILRKIAALFKKSEP